MTCKAHQEVGYFAVVISLPRRLGPL